MVTKELMDKTGIHLPDAHFDARLMADLAKAGVLENCFDNAGVPFCMTVEAEQMGAAVNYGTALYEPHVTGYAIGSSADVGKLRPMDLTSGRAKTVLDAISILSEEMPDVPVTGNLTGPVSLATSLLDPVVFYKEMRKKRSDALALVDFVTDQLIAFGREMVRHGADVIVIADPSGTGEILGPKHFPDFVVRPVNRILDAVRSEGDVRTIVHICGRMADVFDEADTIECDALSFDAIVPMQTAKAHITRRLVMGNVSTYTIEMGDPERVRTLARKCAKDGSDIIAPACGLGMKSPLANVQAVLAALKEDSSPREDIYA